ncbi:TPA: peptidylprolyl isomerase [Candidatus Woesearchaeota archaeon]|nr:peptidylprolyl isomerase [Candidatus Woesearchaeota archaeon]
MAVPRTKVKPHKPNTSGIVEDGNIVVLHYTGTLDSGEKFDSSEGKEPIEFAVGSGVVIPGFDAAVIGMRKGEKKKVTIEAKDAYGDPNPAMRQEVPKHALGDITPEVGMLLALHHPMAPQPIPVKVVAVTAETITIDMNHPLAGQRLHFTLEIVDIK